MKSPQSGQAAPAVWQQESAYEANSPDKWNVIWEREGDGTWRTSALSKVYALIETHLLSRTASEASKLPCVDLGGGRGILASRIGAVVWDRSPVAVAACKAKGLQAGIVDLESSVAGELISKCQPGTVFTATECYEHLREPARLALLKAISKVEGAEFILSVPNDRLGPKDEPQHAVQFDMNSLSRELGQYLHTNVYVCGEYLFAICRQTAEPGVRSRP